VITDEEDINQIKNSPVNSTGSSKSPSSLKPAKPPLPNRPKVDIPTDVKLQPKKPPPPTKKGSLKKPPPVRPPNPNSPTSKAKIELSKKAAVPEKPPSAVTSIEKANQDCPIRPANPSSPTSKAKVESSEETAVPKKPFQTIASVKKVDQDGPIRPPNPNSPTSKAKIESSEKTVVPEKPSQPIASVKKVDQDCSERPPNPKSPTSTELETPEKSVIESSPPTITKAKKVTQDFPERPPQPNSPSPLTNQNTKNDDKPKKPPRANSIKSIKCDIPQRPPNPNSPACPKSKIEFSEKEEMEGKQSPKPKPQLPPQPKAKPRPIPRPRNDRPVPSPRRQFSSDNNAKPEDENTTSKVSESSENATSTSLAANESTELLLHKMDLEEEEEQETLKSEKNANTSPHRKAVKQKSRTPYENVDVQQEKQSPSSPKKNVYMNIPPPPTTTTTTEDATTVEESIYSSPPSSLKTLDGHHRTIEQEDEGIYSSPPSPVKAPLPLSHTPNKQQNEQPVEENIYAAPTSTLIEKTGGQGFGSDPTLTLQSHNRKSISGSFQRPTPLNSNSPVVSYNLLRTADVPPYGPGSEDDSNIYSNLDDQEGKREPQEEILYSAPCSTPVKASFSSTLSFGDKPRSLSELSCGTSTRDSLMSRSSRDSSVMAERSSVFSEDENYSVPVSVSPNTGDSPAIENDRESRYVDMGAAATEPAGGSTKAKTKHPYETIFPPVKPSSTGLFMCFI